MMLETGSADFALLEDLVLSEQMPPVAIVALMRKRPDFALWFEDRAKRRQHPHQAQVGRCGQKQESLAPLS